MSFIAIACFSSKAILVKLIYQMAPISAISTVSLRMLGALPVFIWMAWRTYKPLQKQEIKVVLLAGFLGYYAASFLDFLCLQYISSSLERLILFLNPSLVLLLSFIFLKQKISVQHVLAILFAYCSIAVIFSQEHLGGSHKILGVSLAFASTLCYALYLILCSASVKKIGAMRLTALASCAASFFCLMHFVIQYSWQNRLEQELWMIFQLPTKIYYYSLINSILCTVIPIFLTILAIERCGANIVAQTSILGPSITIFLGVYILDENFGIYHLIGTTGTILSMIFLEYINRRQKSSTH
jgi:drug/metabolite transporter (DMT)-like permease